MKRFTLALLCLLLAASALSAHAQVVPAATARGWSLSAGGEASVAQPDYAGTGVAQTSPNRLYGIGAYVDMKFSRWVQVEGEARFMTFNPYYFGIPPTPNSETTYLIGPRLPIFTFKKATPYGKFLWGLGSAQFLTGTSQVLAYGGGVDYKLSRRFTARADMEYQMWRVHPTLYPYGLSLGVAYKIF